LLFDEAPKTSLADFFDFRDELGMFGDALRKGRRLVVMTGLRRAGKTSLILTALSEERVPHVLVDGRAFAAAPAISRVEFIQTLEQAINHCVRRRRSWWRHIPDIASRVRGVEVEPGMPPSIHLVWGERLAQSADLLTLIQLLGKLGLRQKHRLVIAFDEAQEFRRLAGFNLVKLLAYVCDHVRSVQVVITGSQIGFLHEFLGIEDSKSPLFGRHYTEVRLQHLTKGDALAFFERGFAEENMQVDPKELGNAVSSLNGIIGWLTLVGATARERGGLHAAVINECMTRADPMASDELKNLLHYRVAARDRYQAILAQLASRGPARWSDLKRGLETEVGRKLSPTVFNQLLGNLQRPT
jgi:AAA+ ATPase superfamily predicted ATPase